MKFLRVLLAVMLSVVVFPTPARADLPTNFTGGVISGSQTLPASVEPYKVSSPIDIPEGSSLTLGPGVRIVSTASVLFRVQGELEISGSSGEPVRISVSNGFIQTINQLDDSPAQAVLIKNLEVKGGTQWTIDSKSLSIEDSDFLNQNCATGHEVTIRSPRAIFNGNYLKAACGFTLQITFGAFGPRDAFSMENNHFYGNSKTGPWISASALWEDQLVLRGNTFTQPTSPVLTPGFFETEVFANDNYWGNLNLSQVKNLLVGSAGTVFEPAKVHIERILAAPDPATPLTANHPAPTSDNVSHLVGHGPANGEFSAWTKVLEGGTQMKFYAKYLQVGQKVQFMVQDSRGSYREFAWKVVRATDLGPDGEYTNLQNHVYFIRTLDLLPGKNRVRVYVDGRLVWGTKTYIRG